MPSWSSPSRSPSIGFARAAPSRHPRDTGRAAPRRRMMADWEKVESPGASAEGCKASSGNLKNACDYSFADLYRAACATTSCPCDEVEVKAACESLYELKRDDLNKMVHEWAMTADWETEMQMGSDGQEYLAFAPKSAADKRRDEALYGKYRDALEEKDN